MLYQKSVNWADLEERWKNGVFVHKTVTGVAGWQLTSQVIFAKDRQVIEQFLKEKE